jgi:hypothetical protein
VLVEAHYNFPIAYIGGTFDPAPLKLFQTSADQTWIGQWETGVGYVIKNVVVASNGNAYVAIEPSSSVDPTTDGGVHWTLVTSYDLTGYSAEMPIAGAFTLTSSAGGGLTLGNAAGTIAIKATAAQTAAMAPSNPKWHLQLTDPSGDVYFPVGGNIKFVMP